MAGKDAIYARYNPEVFEVGREQAIQLLHAGWQADIFRYRCEYLIVASLTYFGDWNHPARPSDVREYAGHDTLDAAIADVEKSHAIDMEELFSKSSYDGYEFFAPGWDYEVWHLVDDGELWDEWELKVRTFKELARFICHDTRYYNHKDVHRLSEWVGVCRAVERDTKIITEVERRFIMAHGFGFEFEDMDYAFLHMSGTIYDLTYRYKTAVTVRRFTDKVDYQGWMIRHTDLLSECQHFLFCFSYDHRGIYAYEDPVSDNGEMPMGDLGWVASVLGLDYELADIPSGASGEGVPGGELDEDIVF